MNKFFIGLLIVAIGVGGYYFFLRKKDKPITGNEINKELIVGKWKIDSLSTEQDTLKNELALFFIFLSLDSTIDDQVFDFQKDGNILMSIPSDSLAKTDTLLYELGEQNKLIVKDNIHDSTTDSLTMIELDKKKLVLQSKDSIILYFKKLN